MILNRIQKLSPLVANQIAAGEVIERPASVVKELLENSLDAGADQILIFLEGGGKQLIRITDNGGGIHPEDLPLAITAQATSKLQTIEDLNHLQSLGFRGEALASIAAVSYFKLISALPEQVGWEIAAEGTTVPGSLRPAAHPTGTTVEVRELFFNTPARRRFLRSDKTELAHILNLVKSLALSRDQVGITLLQEGRKSLMVKPAFDFRQREQRVVRLCGKFFVQQSHYLEEQAEGLRLEGWVNHAEVSYAHANLQYFFVNGRAVRDRLLTRAVRLAAQAFLPAHRYPGYVLYLTCEPMLVDVNVHPTKQEVRFQEGRLIHDFVVSALRRFWGEAVALPAVPSDTPFEEHILIEPSVKKEKIWAVRETPLGKPIAQYQQHYLLLEKPDELGILNKWKVFEVILRELFQGSSLSPKPLLLPCSIHLEPAAINNLQAKSIPWKQIGIQWEAVSAQEILLRALPECLKEIDYQALFLALSQSVEWIKTLAHFAAQQYSLQTEIENASALLEKLAGFSEADQKEFIQWIPIPPPSSSV